MIERPPAADSPQVARQGYRPQRVESLQLLRYKSIWPKCTNAPFYMLTDNTGKNTRGWPAGRKGRIRWLLQLHRSSTTWTDRSDGGEGKQCSFWVEVLRWLTSNDSSSLRGLIDHGLGYKTGCIKSIWLARSVTSISTYIFEYTKRWGAQLCIRWYIDRYRWHGQFNFIYARSVLILYSWKIHSRVD